MSKKSVRSLSQAKVRSEFCLCAYCGAHHRVYPKRHVGILDVLTCTGLGLLLTSPFAESGFGIDARGLGLAAIFMGVAEVFVSLRHRMSLRCGRCGFDPVIYRRSHDEAAKLVRSHVARRSADASTLLADPIVPAGRRKQKNSRSENLERT